MTRADRHDDLDARLRADAERLDLEPPRDLAVRVLAACATDAPRAAPTARRRLRPLPTLAAAGALAAGLLVALAWWPRPEPHAAAPTPSRDLLATLTPPGLGDVLRPAPLPRAALALTDDLERLASDATRRAGALVDGLSWPLRKLAPDATPR